MRVLKPSEANGPSYPVFGSRGQSPASSFLSRGGGALMTDGSSHTSRSEGLIGPSSNE